MLPPDYIIQEIRIQNPEVHQSLVKHFKEWNNNEPHESDYILYLHLMRYKGADPGLNYWRGRCDERVEAFAQKYFRS